MDPSCRLGLQQARVHLLDTETFSDAFGPKARRKRPRLASDDYEALIETATTTIGASSCTQVPPPAPDFKDCFSRLYWPGSSSL